MKNKFLFYERPSIKIATRYSATVSFVILLFAILMPKLLNYGPESINTPFDVQMSYIPYWVQYLFVGVLLVSLTFIITGLSFRVVDKFYLSTDPKKYDDIKLIKKVRKKCFSLPYKIPLFEALIPAVSALLVLILTGSHLSVMLVKLMIAIFAFSIILAVLSFIFSKGIYNEVLTKTYKENLNIGLRINLKFKILLQVLPLLVFCIMILTFIGFSYMVRAKEDVYFIRISSLIFKPYTKSLNSLFLQAL